MQKDSFRRAFDLIDELGLEQLQKESLVSPTVSRWLLEENEPSSQYFTLTELMGHDKQDDTVRRAREKIGKEGWAARIFAKQKENTYWENKESSYVPKFTGTGWQLPVLADLGVSSEVPRFANAVDHFLELHNVETGGFSLRPKNQKGFEPHVCNTGNMVRALAKAGYSKDDRVQKAMGWLLSKQLSDSAWNCAPSGKHGSFLATVEPMWALSEMIKHEPRAEWKDAAANASEFVLRHKVYKSDRDDSVVLFDFLKIHYPTHYCYDFLHGLRVLAELGVPRDERVGDALRILRAKQLVDGRWPLEAVYRGWRQSHPMHGTETLSRPEERELVTEGWGTDHTSQLEEAGKPSKWVTLQALLILKRFGLLDSSA